MNDPTAPCALCRGPLLGRVPAIVAGKASYVCARCAGVAQRTAPRIVAPGHSIQGAPSPPPPPTVTLETEARSGPVKAMLCVGAVGVQNFCNDTLLAEPGASIVCLDIAVVGAYQPPPSQADGGTQQPPEPVLLVTIVTAQRVGAATFTPVAILTPAPTSEMPPPGEVA